MLKIWFFLGSILACSGGCDGNRFNDTTLPVGIHPAPDCQQEIGERVCNLVLMDQHDERWELYEHYKEVVLLDLSAMWCGPCQYAAMYAQSLEDDYSADGFQYVTVLVENFYGEGTSLSEVQFWGETFEITTAPVLQGTPDILDMNSAEGYPLEAYPMFVLIDPNLRMHWGMYGFDEEKIRSKIEELL